MVKYRFGCGLSLYRWSNNKRLHREICLSNWALSLHPQPAVWVTGLNWRPADSALITIFDLATHFISSSPQTVTKELLSFVRCLPHSIYLFSWCQFEKNKPHERNQQSLCVLHLLNSPCGLNWLIWSSMAVKTLLCLLPFSHWTSCERSPKPELKWKQVLQTIFLVL